MGTPLSGPGLGLPLPQYLYPTELQNAPYDASTNAINIAPGTALPIPAGTWYVSLGQYLVVQYYNPVHNTWSTVANSAWTGSVQYIKSDGFNYRIANLTGCPIGAAVAALGSAYVQASTTIVQTPGNGTWAPIIGGQVSLSTVANAGAGYGTAPIVLIPAPPPPANNANGVGGMPAAGYATIQNGTVSGFTLTSPGAGYPSAPVVTVLPNPTDPNLSTGITAASIVLALGTSGVLAGAFCTNPGAPLANPANITLTIAGAGIGASLTAKVLQTVSTASITGAGTGYGTTSALMTVYGGVSPLGSIVNGDSLGLSWRTRNGNIGFSITNAGTIGTQLGQIFDGGLFISTPNFVIAIQPQTATTVAIVQATVALTMGNRNDIAVLQPAP